MREFGCRIEDVRPLDERLVACRINVSSCLIRLGQFRGISGGGGFWAVQPTWQVPLQESPCQ